jgi:hypothetical protein
MAPARSSCQDFIERGEVFTRISTRSSHKESQKTPNRISQDHTRTCCCWQEPPRRAFIQASLLHGICKIFMPGPLREERGFHQDLYKIFC